MITKPGDDVRIIIDQSGNDADLVHYGDEIYDFTEALAFEADRTPTPPYWLRHAPWRWKIIGPEGRWRADGEGCTTAAAAIERAKECARQEGWLR